MIHRDDLVLLGTPRRARICSRRTVRQAGGLAGATLMHIATDVTSISGRARRPAPRRDVLARSTTGTQCRPARDGRIARARPTAVLAANADDLAAEPATAAFRDRLTLTPSRVEAMAKGLEDIAALPTRSAGRWPTGRGRTGCAFAASPRRSA